MSETIGSIGAALEIDHGTGEGVEARRQAPAAQLFPTREEWRLLAEILVNMSNGLRHAGLEAPALAALSPAEEIIQMLNEDGIGSGLQITLKRSSATS